MPPDDQPIAEQAMKWLIDAQQAARSIIAFAKTRRVDDLADDDLFRSAIYWKFMIVGEALSRLRSLDETKLARVHEAHRIIGFRNQIVHGYSRIDDEITWRIIEQKLPVLLDDLRRLGVPD